MTYIFVGYPYEKPEEVENDLKELLCADLASANCTDNPCENDSILLMTHCGPGNSQTAIQQIDIDEPIITAGCFVLDKILREPRQVTIIFITFFFWNIH